MAQRPLVMRIITRLAGGGPPVHATLLNRNLDRHGFDSVLVFGDCSPQEHNMEYLLAEDDAVERIPSLGASPNLLLDIVALVRLWFLMLRYRPSIVHTHTAKAGLLGRVAALFAGVPCIVHTFHGHVLEGYFAPWINRALCILERWLARFSTALFTVSRQQAEELSSRFAVAAENKFHVVPLGLELQSLLEISPPDYSTTTLRIAWLGRYVPIKNLPLLIEVAFEAQRRNLSVEFVIAGDGPERWRIEDAVIDDGLNNVSMLPWQNPIDPVLAGCHLLILTSHREGTPLALIQGMAAARPFIATPAGGTVDLAAGPARSDCKAIWHDNCVFVPPEASAFVDTIEELCGARARLKSMSASSREFARTRFDETRLVSDIANLYERLLAESRVPGDLLSRQVRQ